MKKTFPLKAEGKNPERMLEATKHEIRKYIKRERRRDLPEGVDFWDFDCKFGTSSETASVAHLADSLLRFPQHLRDNLQRIFILNMGSLGLE